MAHAHWIGPADLPREWQVNLNWELGFSGYDTMLLAIIGCFGWLPFFLIQAPVAVLLALGWRKLRRQTSLLGKMLGTAALSVLTWQAGAYLLQMFSGLFGLLTAFPYPFLSDGGTALVVDCALLGLLLSVFREETIIRDAPVPQAPQKETA